MIENLKFYIDGQWVLPQVKNDFNVINPANEEVCATISLGDKADTDAAVAAANKAFPTWSATPHAERIK